MSTPNLQSATVPNEWRYRCFGPSGSSRRSCRRSARWWAPDADRQDAVTFFCDGCRPNIAKLIDREGEYLEIAVSGLVVIAASTFYGPDAIKEAVSAITDALEGVGAVLVPIKAAAVRKRPLPILGQKVPAAAAAGGRNGDRTSG